MCKGSHFFLTRNPFAAKQNEHEFDCSAIVFNIVLNRIKTSHPMRNFMDSGSSVCEECISTRYAFSSVWHALKDSCLFSCLPGFIKCQTAALRVLYR